MKVVHYVAETDTTLANVLATLRADKDAIAEGRVFVGKTRATSATLPVPRGVRVALTSKGDDAPEVAILHRSEGLLDVDKPAGLPTIADGRTKSHTLLAAAARAAKLPESALHPTSRLDREVSGVVTFATTAEGRRELARARDEGRYARRYVALAVRSPAPASGLCEAPIGIASDPRYRKVDPGGERASSRYTTVASTGAGVALLALGPITGRTHQLRVHASSLGAPLLGDKTYGGATRLTLASGKSLGFSRVFLHCAKVRYLVFGVVHEIASHVPRELVDTWAALGGEPAAWDRALAWDTLA